MRAIKMQVIVVAIVVGLGVVSQAPAYYAGGGKDAAKGDDCLVGYEFVDPGQVTDAGTKKPAVVCVDCDPSCDLDGVPTANGSCTMAAGVCIDQSGVAQCTPPSGLDKASAKGKVQGVKGATGKIVIDTSQLLEGSACGAMVGVVMPLKSTKKGLKERKATIKLSALVKKNKSEGISKRTDKDKLTYICQPRPEGDACPSASTTTTVTSTTTTSTVPNLCGNAVLDPGEECDDGNANDGDGCTRNCTLCGNGTVTPPEECETPLTCTGGANNTNPCASDDDCPGGFCTTKNIPGCDANCTLPACGNSNVSGDETCDDGNTSDFDNCPSDCIIDSCSNPGGSYVVSVNFAGSEDVAGITVFVDYPEGSVILPGSGSDASALVTNLPGTAGASANDYDHAVQVAVADFAAFPSGLLFNLDFQSCDGAMPAAGEFTCTVLSAGDANLQPVSGVTCSVSVP
jgi:cysteine-rich repeat protein